MGKSIIINGLGFGDEGKGKMTDYIVRKEGASAVVRYNGGPQAAHNVVLPDGRHHTFSQFGSGSFVDGVKTYLSAYCLIDPLVINPEALHLQQLGVKHPWDRLVVSGYAVVITPFHRYYNRLSEIARGDKRHGSCGVGVGACMEDMQTRGKPIFAWALKRDSVVFLRERLKQAQVHFIEAAMKLKLSAVQQTDPEVLDILQWIKDPSIIEVLIKDYHNFAEAVTFDHDGEQLYSEIRNNTVVFEGAQGVLLDEVHGFQPYTTWSTTTPKNARNLIRCAGGKVEVTTIGVLRAFATRHGPGPFPTEANDALAVLKEQEHNTWGRWQGDFRVGHFDEVLLRHALQICSHENCGIDALALTCLDRAKRIEDFRYCRDYHNFRGESGGPLLDIMIPTAQPKYSPDINTLDRACERINSVIPIRYISRGPTWQNSD